MTLINAAAGRRVAVIRRVFSSVPMDYTFSASAAAPGHTVSGTVEIRKSRWVFPGQPVTLPLQEHNVVSAGLWNTFMSVDVVPAVDVIISTDGWTIRGLRMILILGVVVVAIAAAVAIVYSG